MSSEEFIQPGPAEAEEEPPLLFLPPADGAQLVLLTKTFG